ncbi:hypothetical protein ACWFQ8_18180 [Streptomyces sp. NPDC055254]
MEQPVDVHGRNSVQVHQEIALVHDHVVQRALEHLSRTLVELPSGTDQNRAAACWTSTLINVLLPSPEGSDLRGPILARRGVGPVCGALRHA